jgi:small ligand-binding sensory domain FIST
MKAVYTIDELNQRIKQLEAQQDAEWIAIKDEIDEIKENLKPLNLIRNTVAEINETVGFKSDLAQSAISIGIGYLAKKLVVGKTDSIFKNILGSILQLAVTTLVAKPQHEAAPEESS